MRRHLDQWGIHIHAPVTRWEHARGLLPFTDICETEVLARLLAEDAHLWTSPLSAAVTEVADDGWFHIVTMGGCLSDVAIVLPQMEALARAMGCHGVRLEGRTGWRRALLKHGYAREGDKVVKRL